MKFAKKKILICITVFIFCLLCLYFYYLALATNGNASHVVIKQDGKVIKTLSLDKDTNFLVKSPLGENVISVKDGSVTVSQADCPDKICVRTAPLTKENAATSVIVCLPHKLIVSLE